MAAWPDAFLENIYKWTSLETVTVPMITYLMVVKNQKSFPTYKGISMMVSNTTQPENRPADIGMPGHFRDANCTSQRVQRVLSTWLQSGETVYFATI